MAKDEKTPLGVPDTVEPVIMDPQKQTDMNDPHLSGQEAVVKALAAFAPDKELAE